MASEVCSPDFYFRRIFASSVGPFHSRGPSIVASFLIEFLEGNRKSLRDLSNARWSVSVAFRIVRRCKAPENTQITWFEYISEKFKKPTKLTRQKE